MNVIISNKQQALLANLNIEVIKTVNGVFKADELVDMFSNFFFGRMILDLTALENYKDIRNLQKISISLPVEKMIILLPPGDAEVNSPQYISKMISMGIYNFTKDLEGINYLLQNPNGYRDVAHLHQIEEPLVVEKQVMTPSNNIGPTVNNDYTYQPVQNVILGIKSLTEGAGSTTLCYLLKRELQKRGISTLAVEIDRRDFVYLNDKELVSITKDELAPLLLKNRGVQVIIIDLNSMDTDMCTDSIYLLEPSYIKLNKLMMRDRKVFERLKNDKIVLSKSLLTNSDIAELEYEAKVKFFYAMPYLDDRKDNEMVLSELLQKLGII